MFFKRSQVVLLILVVLMAVAVYINISYKSDDGDYEITKSVAEVSSEDSTKILGEIRAVSSEVTPEDTTTKDDYFAAARLARTKARDEAISMLTSVLNDSEADTDAKEQAQNEIIQISEAVQQENKIESILKAKGFSDCVVHISDAGVSVVVNEGVLDQIQIAKITETVITETGVSGDKIRIIEEQ